MTQHDFRRLALGLSDAVEGAHMGHPDFRVKNRIFATIHTDPQHGMVKLTPAQQQVFVRDFPKIFAPESGAWGRSGSTRVLFAEADEEVVGEVMTLAWKNVLEDHAARGPKRNPPMFSEPAPSSKGSRRRSANARSPRKH
jgi:YjbR protein